MRGHQRAKRVRGAGRAVGLGITVVIIAVLLASPRHREFYSRLFSRPSAPVPVVTAPPPATVPTPPAASPPGGPPSPGAQPEPAPASPRPSGYALPIPAAPPPGSPPPPAEPAQKPQKTPPLPGLSPAMAAKVPRGGPGTQVVVKILDEIPKRLPVPGAPLAWELKEFVGRAQVEVVKDGDRIAVHLLSERTSYALYRDVTLDVKEFPLLAWGWKVAKLPTGGDIRERTTDDQAAQVYVIFPRWPFPRINSDVIGYIWDSRAPVGLRVTSPQSSNVKLIVLRSGTERVGQWVREERNVHEDYVELFGKEPPRVGKVAIMIDSNDTRSQAEAFVDELVFRRGPAGTSSADPPPAR